MFAPLPAINRWAIIGRPLARTGPGILLCKAPGLQQHFPLLLTQNQMILQDERVETCALEGLNRITRPAYDRLLNIE